MKRRTPVDTGITARGVGHGSIADNIVGNDQAAAARELERPSQIVRIVLFAGVDEDQVEWTPALRGELRQRVQRPPQARLHQAGQPGAGDVGAGDFGVRRVGFQRDEAGRARASQIVL